MPTALAVGPARVAERPINPIHSVQGINSSIDHVLLRGDPMEAAIGQAIAEVKLERKLVGASVLTISVFDPHRNLLQSALLEEAHEVIVDGLRWKLVKVGQEGRDAPLVLTYEPLLVYLLKRIVGPNKALREKVTRAEFAKLRFLEGVNPKAAAKQAKKLEGQTFDPKSIASAVHGLHARFISPELHVVQPIAEAKQGKKAQEEAEATRNKGIGTAPAHLKIFGKAPTKAQTNILDRMLRTAQSESSPEPVMEALVLACIDESGVGTLSSNLLEQEPSTAPNTDHTNPEESAKGFLTGYGGGGGGALDVYKEHPNYSPAEIATTVQRNAAFLNGGLSAGAAPYERFNAEGREWVEAFGGGTGSLSDVMTVKYQFKQGKKESNWHNIVRLAGEVNWRAFESAGWLYFLNDRDLLDSHRRLIVSDSAPGIIDTTFDYDIGKTVNEITVEAQAKSWSAPPGTVAAVTHHGPANGDYLVEKIEAVLQNRPGIVQITLKKPTEPLPEPAPKTRKVSSGGAPAGSSTAIAAMIAEIDRIDKLKYPYASPGARGTPPPSTGPYDCSGGISRVLYVGGFLKTTTASAELAAMFEAGKGDDLVIYAKGPDGPSGHTWGEIRTSEGWKPFGTSQSNPGGGFGWISEGSQDSTAGYSARHPKGT